MARMVKAVRMILGLESFGPNPKKPLDGSPDIEIEDDEPKRKPSLEEIDALEVQTLSAYLISILFLFSKSHLLCEFLSMLCTCSLAYAFCA